MKTWLVFAVVWIAFGSAPHQLTIANAKEKAPPTPSMEEQVVVGLVCISGKEERRLSVITKSAGCTLQYFKSGKSNQLAAAKHGVDLCKAKMDRVRTTLEAVGYECK